MVVYCFYVQPFYNNLIKEYTHIIVVNREPDGPLKNFVCKAVFPQLSTFEGFHNNLCVYAVKNMASGCNAGCNNATNDFLSVDNIDILIAFLMENDYTINKDITKIMNNEKIYVNNGKKLLFYVNYSS